MRSREFGVFRMMILLVFVSSFALSSAHTSEKMPTDVDPHTDKHGSPRVKSWRTGPITR